MEIFTILEEHFGPSQVVGNEKDGICIVLSRDQWKLVTFEDYTNGTFGFLLSFGVFPCRKKRVLKKQRRTTPISIFSLIAVDVRFSSDASFAFWFPLNVLAQGRKLLETARL